jgi:four helix bundle protein
MSASYRELQVWQKSMQLAKFIYETTREFPKEEIYCLTNQLRRSAISIPSNIAEGNGRNSDNEFKRFLLIALGSTYELQTQLDIASSLGYFTQSRNKELSTLADEIGKMLFALHKSLH